MSAKECLEALGKKKKNLLTTTENFTEKYIPRHEKPQQSKIGSSKLGSCFKGREYLFFKNSLSLSICLSRCGQCI